MPNSYSQKYKPTEIRLNREKKVLEVDFETGEKFRLPAELLRVESPSAEVQGHGPGQKILVAGRRHVGITDILPVGNYAISIKFDDTHNSGIYAWDTLDQFGRDDHEIWNSYLDALEREGLSRDP